MTFDPTLYMRLNKRASRIMDGVVHYTLSENGIEDPKCTIIPVMLVRTDDQQKIFIEYDEKVYEAKGVMQIKNGFVVSVPIGASPVS